MTSTNTTRKRIPGCKKPIILDQQGLVLFHLLFTELVLLVADITPARVTVICIYMAISSTNGQNEQITQVMELLPIILVTFFIFPQWTMVMLSKKAICQDRSAYKRCGGILGNSFVSTNAVQQRRNYVM